MFIMKFLIGSLTLIGIVSAGLVGNIHKIDPNSESLKKVLRIAEIQISNQINSIHTHHIVKVIDASSQIVSGILYRVTFTLGETDCMKKDLESGKVKAEDCVVKSHVKRCTAHILSPPGSQNIQVSELKCQQENETNIGEKRSIIDQNSENMQIFINALNKVSTKISYSIGGEHHFVQTKISNVESQVVAGMNFFADIEFTETSCPINSELLSECKQKLINGSIKKCKVQIYVKPWADVYELSSIHCI